MGNGNSLWCSQLCKDVELILQGHKFLVDLYVLPKWGLDVVLGMQWLQTLGPCIHDHRALTMEFQWQGSVIKLAGTTTAESHQLSSTQLRIMCREGDIRDVFMLATVTQEEAAAYTEVADLERQLPLEGRGVLFEFQDVFAEPTQLPPHRMTDHRIFLQPGSKPVNVRPYRYPYFQKDIIEKLVREMEQYGFVQPSNSPYSSPILLVKKKDGSWRFCIDYRALNDITIKDRFPIPTIDELLDELGGATVFSKLGLRAGYHQIRMDSRDIHKTTFRTHEGHYEFRVMPFGLTNAPSTFQATMNQVFKPLLRHCVIVFFDDILVYSKTGEDHRCHLRLVLQKLRDHQFYAKGSKCKFFQPAIDYLGHLVSAQGVQADPSKIAAMVEWPQSRTIKQLRGFLGLTGYYRRFVAHYATIAAPLTKLLKDNFVWTEQAEIAFRQLKSAMTKTPVLILPDFSKIFIIESDASNVGIGAVLMQENHPIAFFSKKLGPKFVGASAYLRELSAIVEAVTKWRQYLLGRHFVIRTDHRSLKELLTQVIQTPEQQHFLRKLIGFSFSIEYKAGKTNSAADALSRRHDGASSFLTAAISSACFDFLDELRRENTTCQELRHIHNQLAEGTLTAADYSVREGLLYYRQRIRVSSNSNFKQQLIREFHDTPMGGHAGVERTFLRLSANFFWPGMKSEVRSFVQSCLVCQTVKYSPAAPYGLLQPLELPERVWEDLAMDFIVGLPNSFGVTNILVVVDRFTKYANFGALPNHYSATKVADLFSHMVIRLHGMPRSIVSDRDPIFTSAFWKKLFEFMGTKLKMSSSYHPQTDGQTEVTNRYLEQYLRAFTADNPKQWSKFLSWAEYHYNTSHHSAIGMTPFQAVYGRAPPTIPAYTRGSTTIQAVENDLLSRDTILQQLKDNLLQAQHRMRQQANKKRRDIEFKVGELVLVKLQPYRQATVAKRLNYKLCRRYFGPFPVLARVGAVAYTLELPAGSRIHPTFHVSLLKPFHGNSTLPCFPLPEHPVNNKPVMTPQAILATRTSEGKQQVLVQWSLCAPEDATWEDFPQFCQLYGFTNLADKVVFEQGSSVGPAQLESPIALDPKEMQEKVRSWIEQASCEGEPTQFPGEESCVEKEEKQPARDGERVQAREARVRVRPRWLKEFVRLEQK
ncbi:transposon Ty3-I Gag-Pol polyprotein isoform X1 [Humulus lupulus]|uniref:transposon Ty3-I Gag-Pol polyprotein isoform X1 n=1 Tax=Humulus lupulus TaxID=3486 RepID=UPI002B418025|nr:transposon Ty3-I Gag-Pol polyprotein isoform X1 [Humulus lupulus]